MPLLAGDDSLWFIARAVTQAAGTFGPSDIAGAVEDYIDNEDIANMTFVGQVTLSKFTANNSEMLAEVIQGTQERLDTMLKDPNNAYLSPTSTFTNPDIWNSQSMTLSQMATDLMSLINSSGNTTAVKPTTPPGN